MNNPLQKWPFVPSNPSKWNALQRAARRKWGNNHGLGFIGHDDEMAYFQDRGSDEEYALSLDFVEYAR